MTDDTVAAVPVSHDVPVDANTGLRVDESTPQFSTSATFGKLAAALARVQKKLKQPSKQTANTFFKSKYADLHEVWAAASGLLADEGIAVIQTPAFSTSMMNNKVIGIITISTTLVHGESSEWMTNVLRGTVETINPQSIGSGISYFRRYGLQPMLMLTPDDGSDDDGERAEGRTMVPAEDKPPVEDIEKHTKAVKEAKTLDALKIAYDAIPANHRKFFNKLVGARKTVLEQTPGVKPAAEEPQPLGPPLSNPDEMNPA